MTGQPVYPHHPRARRRRALLPRLRGQPHAAIARARARRLRDRHPARRPGAGALGLPSLDELPLGGGPRQGREVTDPDEKSAALDAIVEHVILGRSARFARPARRSGHEVLALPLTEASAKMRTGPPIDDEEDYALDVWAGIVPLETRALAPAPYERLTPGTPVPEHVARVAQ